MLQQLGVSDMVARARPSGAVTDADLDALATVVALMWFAIAEAK